jgi:hypothetical protein
MSAYKGHRGPNVSAYVQNLNQPSPPQDLLDSAPVEDFSDILNFDINDGRNPSVDFNSPVDFNIDFVDEQPLPLKTDATIPRNLNSASADPNMEFNLNGDFQFTDFGNFGANTLLDQPMPLGQPQPNHYPLAPSYASPASALSPLTQGYDQASKKRKLDNLAPVNQQALDENARVAAEEDKRRRNTAASARFRVKKKQREQALEEKHKAMTEKVNKLEATISQLQTENQWLKGLITEKNGGKSTPDEVKALLAKHEQANSGRSNSAHTDGVGTEADNSKVVA